MNYQEYRLALKNGTALPKVKAAKAIPKESKKMTSVKAELKKLYTIFLSKRTRCEIKSPECTGKATVIHHVKGRGKDNLMNESTWMASCVRCNGWVEENHAEAVKMGAKQSRHKKNNTSVSNSD